jgi:hypothetical protein
MPFTPVLVSPRPLGRDRRPDARDSVTIGAPSTLVERADL